MQRQLIFFFLLLNNSIWAQRNYTVQYIIIDATVAKPLPLQTNFPNQNQAANYIAKLPALFKANGYITHSIDTVLYQKERAEVKLFYGAQYHLAKVAIQNIPYTVLVQNGWDINAQRGKYNLDKLYQVQTRLLNYYQELGYPFAKVTVDSVTIVNDSMFARLALDTGKLYKIDSVRNLGLAKIKRSFLQQYLNIKPQSIYKKSALDNIPRKISLLPYVTEQQPYSLTMLHSSAIVNVYLQPKKSSIINVLLGVIPAPNPNGLTNAPQNKLFLSGDANILLNNAMSLGETIGLTYQQLSINSRRINLLYQHPYVFKSNYGIETQFELYKRDSSFINIDAKIGVRYSLGDNKNGKLFLQQIKTNSFPDTMVVKQTKKLPPTLDVRLVNIGLQYEWNTTNNLRTPTAGAMFTLTSSFGKKQISKNSTITNLKAGGFNFGTLYDSVKLNTYQIKLLLHSAYYKMLGKQSVLKLAVQGGYLQSQNYLRNELFQIGGFKILRGFDEESQFCNQYVVPTIEWRYLLGGDSYFFTFIDGGYTRNSVLQSIKHTYVGTGVGMSFATKTGIFNLSLAAGGRDDIRFGFKQSKLHFGYLSVF